MVAHLYTPYPVRDILGYGKKKRDFVLLGERVTIRRMGRSGKTTGPMQAVFYVCNETTKTVICGPLTRLAHADAVIGRMLEKMQVELTFGDASKPE